MAEEVVQHSRHPLGAPFAGVTAAMRTPQVLHGPQSGRMPSQRGAVSSALCIPLVTAADTLVGIRQWWLPESLRSTSIEMIRLALAQMVASGELRRETLGDGSHLYALPRAQGTGTP